MTPPGPPWRLYGWAGLLVDWIGFDQVRDSLLPQGFLEASFFRSDTLSGHYFGCYRPAQDATFREGFHEFGYITCIAKWQEETGFHLARMAVDHAGALEGGRDYWGIDKVPGEFERTGDYGLHVVSDGGRLDVSVSFRKWISLGYWEAPFHFINRVPRGVLKYRVVYNGELFYCKAEKHRIHPRGRVLPLLFDRCWVTIEAPVLIEDKSSA
jgi:hypothetical protein